jgi:endonuclease/exonuclease/phosphatase family metal-dependent hydrolase
MLPTSHSEPGSLLDDVRLIDRDAILVRSDVSYSNVAEVHYTDTLVIDASLGIVVPRGYAAVTADINGQSYRFATTHLESFDISLVLRNGQLNQLIAEMENETIPVILAGDFNFNPDSFLYERLIQNGYEDAWTNNTLTYNTAGFTYGHDDDLLNSSADFSTRIDYVFVKSSNSFSFEESFVVGDELRDRTPSNLWPSDHGGVVSKINFNQ